MHNLEFNVGTGSIHQLPQTTGDGIHSLLQEVMWDVGDNFPNPVLHLFQCVRFCPVQLLLSPTPQGVRSGFLAGHSCGPRRPSARSLTVKRPAIFVVIARAASIGHCPPHRRTNYQILFRDVYIHYFHYDCFNITKFIVII